MTSLQITPTTLINTVLLFISVITFVFAYNKRVKNSVDKTDLTDLKQYVDQQDRSLSHRIDEVHNNVEKSKDEINRKLDLILNKLINK